MIDLLNKNNWHLFLEKTRNKNNSFIANVNLLVDRFDVLVEVLKLFPPEKLETLLKIAGLYSDDLMVLINDLNKGSRYGYRKIDIDLLKNFKDYSDTLTNAQKIALWNDPSKQVYYEGISVRFNDKTLLYKEFNELGVPTPINNHHKLYSQLDDWAEFKAKYDYTMFDIVPNTPIPNHELLRIWDGEATGSSIDSITLHVASKGNNQAYDVVFAGAKEYSPVYTWLDTTSVLITIVNKINELLQIADNVPNLLTLKTYLPELTAIYAVLDKLASTDFNKDTIYKYLKEIVAVAGKLNEIDNLNTTFKNTLEHISELEKDKANKIKENIDLYDVTYGNLLNNNTKELKVGDTLFSNPFTFKITKVDSEGKALEGIISPSVVDSNLSDIYTFKNNENNTSFGLHIICKEKNPLTKVLDLVDVYTELKKLDVTSTLLFNNTNTKLNIHEEKIEELQNIINNLDFDVIDDGLQQVLSTFVKKVSDVAQTIDSDIILGKDKKLSVTASKIIDAIKVIENNLILGDTNVTLKLHTFSNRIDVITPRGNKQIAYLDDIPKITEEDKKPVVEIKPLENLIGQVLLWAGLEIPDNCKEADGSTYAITDYPKAFEVLSNKFGGDGIVSFAVPFLKGAAPVGCTYIIVLGDSTNETTNLYCGKDGVWCGKPFLYCGTETHVDLGE